MCPDVIVERGGPSEGAPAVATLEGPVAGVRHHVVPQLRRLGEGLGAVATLVGPAVGNTDSVPSVLSAGMSRKPCGSELPVFPVISKQNCGCISRGLSWEAHTQNFTTSSANEKFLGRN